MNDAVAIENSRPSGVVRLASFIARYGLLVFISWQLAQITWWLLGHNTEQQVVSYQAKPQKSVSTVTGVALSAIGLFGDVASNENPNAVTIAPVDAPDTALKLELKGVVAANRKEDGGAIIAERGKDALYYRVGDQLPANAELVEVYSDRVLLRRSGKIETLRFPEVISESEKVVASTGQSKANNINNAQDFLGEAEKRLTKDPLGTLGAVGLAPVSAGESSGYVYNGQNPMLRQMNLQKGDIIRSVNGFPIGDVQKDRDLLKQFYSEGNVLVEIERDGTFFSINYPLR
ncbi:MAG: general secretion pathway protein GspC [Hahellaceae bacterium]|jgi:general secretion pathway protein C|nr:general secretion pathway protein GspC [Hahellaceae bacterium]MCP5211614.1 general secretion pathway protein GspC [Hahellaceae bacterium]